MIISLVSFFTIRGRESISKSIAGKDSFSILFSTIFYLV